MNAPAFDTLKLARGLRDKAHFPQEQAEGAADALADAIQSEIAMKSDLDRLESSLRQAISDAKSESIKWTVGMVGFQILTVIGIAAALTHGVHF